MPRHLVDRVDQLVQGAAEAARVSPWVNVEEALLDVVEAAQHDHRVDALAACRAPLYLTPEQRDELLAQHRDVRPSFAQRAPRHLYAQLL